jgi:hypothetical protein
LDSRPTLGFKATGTSASSDHQALSNRSDASAHAQYLLKAQTDSMGINLDMGGFSITNINLVDGIDVNAHVSRHLPNGADALATGTPSAIGNANTTGTANAFARQDHIHDHGSHTVGTDHAAVTTSVNGFMSSTDKTTFDAATNLNTISTIVKRDSSGNFSAGTITASLTGNATNVTGVVVVVNGGTNSSAALSNNRVMKSSGDAIIEAAAITAARALISDANGIPTHSNTTSTELGFVSGVTSAIQTQLGTKANLTGGNTFTGKQVLTPTATVSGINVGSLAGDPSAPVNGDIWYNSTENEFKFRETVHLLY